MRFVARSAGAPDLAVELALAGVHNVRECAGRDRGRPRSGRRRRGDREARCANSRASAGASSAIDGARPWRRALHADRRLRPPSGRDGGDAVARRARAFPGGASCSRSSRTATRARATCSRTSSACCRRVDALVLTDVYAAGEAPIVAADGRALARAVRVAGKVEPVFVDDVDAMADAIAQRRARRRRRADDGRRLDRPGAGGAGEGRMMNMADVLHFERLRGTLARDAPLARYTTWRAGGNADRPVRAGRPRRSRAVPAPAAAAMARDGARARQQRAGARRRRARRRDRHAQPRRRAGDRRRPGLRRGRRGVAQARALRRDAWLRRRIPRRHSRHRRRRAGDERRLLRRRDLAARGEGRGAGARRRVRDAHARRLPDRLSQRAARRRRRRGRHFHRGVVPLRVRRRARGARAHQGAARASASPRSRCRSPTPAACSAIRRATTRRA